MRLFVDQLTNVDFSYLCPSRGLLGETWLASIELKGELNDQGMVCDFGLVKKVCRQWFDEIVDHRLLVPSLNPRTELSLQEIHDSVVFASDIGAVRCTSPKNAITDVPCNAITKESLARWCEQQLKGQFGDSILDIRVQFEEETISGPFYHYSHGLKKHGGNCQRIAHGHRSKIMIWKNGALDETLMQLWADRWRDIYIATRADLLSSDETHHHFSYRAQQGHFNLSIPHDRCYFVETDTTVEYLAQHIADTLSRETGDNIKVKAYEGLAKGAIVETRT